MKLAEALRIVQAAPDANAEGLTVFLACGFEPLHLGTFLSACLRLLLPHQAIEIETGIYGDLAGNLERLQSSAADCGVVVFEWPDFDVRLGLRSLGGWGASVVSDILFEASRRADSFLELLRQTAAVKPLTICLPALPLPPISYQPTEQASVWRLELTETLAIFAKDAAQIPNLKVLNAHHLDTISPIGERRDVKSELSTGFPYRLAHAARLAEMLATLVQPRAAMKGLITDLDDTLWQGLLGEDGVGGISWDLDQHSHIHALYQQTLAALADAGVLLGVASKNDAGLVIEAFERADLLLKADQIFPFEVGWHAKSQSVARILQTWNVGSDSVIFIDDSPLELAEVKAAFPELNCLLFPKGDDQAAYELLETLRQLFGRELILEEDTIRRESLRRSAELRAAGSIAGTSADSFLQQAEAELTLNLTYDAADRRTLELINKTNQFNLNGRRLTEAELHRQAQAPDAFFLQVAYKDKYGPLGKIAVMLGRRHAGHLLLETWVMSCRAFSRRIEHQCLQYIFDKLNVSQVTFDFAATERNRPLQEFLTDVLGQQPESPFVLDRDTFASHRPSLPHAVSELNYA